MDADQKSHFAHLLQLAATLLVALYMLLIGGSFDATVRFRVQLLNALAAGVLALAWLIIRLRQRARLAHTGRELSLLAFVLSQWVAAGTSAQPRLSFEFAASVTAWSIAFLILCDVLASGWPRSYVLHALVLAAFIIAAQALWEVAAWFALWAGLGQFPPTAFRLNGFLGHPNLTAAALNLLLPLVIAQMLMARKTITRLALGALALSMLAAEFFSSSRAGWIAGGATLGLMAGLLAWERREQIGGWALRWRRWPLPVRLGSFTFALGLLAAGGWLFVRQSQHATHGSLLFSRQGFWLPAWNLFLAHPLTGAGPELYPWFFPLSYSIPPDEVIPHPHSLIFQLLSGSGLIGLGAALGLGAAGALRLWRRWQDGPDRLWTAAFASSLFGVFVHHLFDYFFSTPAFVFLFVVVSALAFAPDLTPPPSPFRRGGQLHPSLLALPLALMMGITAFSLRGAALNDQGLQLATQGNWAGAARAFQRAAELDPGLTLYWAEAAQAATRAGDAQSALPLWQRARHDDPNWAVWPATLAVLTGDPAAMQPAQQLAPRSDLFALNAGALAEAAGDPVAAREHYQRALSLNSRMARALFWQQTPLRADVLAEWQAAQPEDKTPLAQGWAALEAGDADRAIRFFEEALSAYPLSNLPYLGLAQAYWAWGDEARAEAYFHIGQNLPVYAIWETLDIRLFEGDWAAAHGDRAGAIRAYTTVFSAFNEYTSAGPGTYGYPWRGWIVFHRAALPTDLVPQFVHADITAEMDARFAQLAQWYAEDGEMETACFIVRRVIREAPVSETGRLREKLCP